MASFLILDWDYDQFHIVAAQSSRRGISVSRAVTWTHPEPFTPGTAERVGKALKEFLKNEKFAGAPVIFGVGRDRIFLKELRFPAVAAHEEANLVRFQTGKEMAEPVDNYAIDYSHLSNGSTERHIMTVAARRDILAMIQTMCQAAGLKLQGVTPKLFGIAEAVARAHQPDPSPLGPKQLSAVLTIGHRWAELCFFKGNRLLQAQALANGPLLAGEVKRNLAVFQAQHAVDVELTAPDCLYVFGNDVVALQALEKGQPLPIKSLDPLKPEPKIAASVTSPGDFAGAVGLAVLWATEKPVNLAAPKRMSAPVSETRQRFLVYGVAAAVLAVILIGLMYYTLNSKREQLVQLNMKQSDLKADLAKYAQERADVDYYMEWEQTTVPWLDEMYDLTERYPFKENFRVNQLMANTISTTGAKKVKGGPIGKMDLTIAGQAGKSDEFVKQLYDAMLPDRHLRPALGKSATMGTTTTYSVKAEINKQDAKKYMTKLVIPSKAQLAFEAAEAAAAEKKAEALMPPDEKKDTDPDDPDPDGGAR